jgi:hypothetical protein
MKYCEAEKLSIENHPELDEEWVEDRFAEDPSILGLGDLVLKNRQRIPSRGDDCSYLDGRLLSRGVLGRLNQRYVAC